MRPKLTSFLVEGCSEEIVLRMDINHAQLSWEVKCVENCSATDEVAGAQIVNVDAIFVIPPELQGLDRVFPRFAYSHDMYEAAKRAGSVVDASAIPADALKSTSLSSARLCGGVEVAPQGLVAGPERQRRAIRKTDRGGAANYIP